MNYFVEAFEMIRGTLCNLVPMSEEYITSKYAEWMNDTNVCQYLESRFKNHTVSSLKEYFYESKKRDDVIFYAICTPEGKHIGNIKIGSINRYHLTADIGFLVGDRDYQGKGIATEAISLAVNRAFELGIEKVSAGAYENNVASISALKKCGFEQEGYLKSNIVFNGKRIGSYIFAINK